MSPKQQEGESELRFAACVGQVFDEFERLFGFWGWMYMLNSMGPDGSISSSRKVLIPVKNILFRQNQNFWKAAHS